MKNVERNTDAIKKKASQKASFEFDLLKTTDQPIAIISGQGRHIIKSLPNHNEYV